MAEYSAKSWLFIISLVDCQLSLVDYYPSLVDYYPSLVESQLGCLDSAAGLHLNTERSAATLRSLPSNIPLYTPAL